MKTDTLTTVETWLPIFSGFYDTIWETDCGEESEAENINEIRVEKGLAPITVDDVEFDYVAYFKEVAVDLTSRIGDNLKTLGFISDYKFQELRSPKEYNFVNDSIHWEVVLSEENKKKIRAHLTENEEEFAAYLKDKYTSRSGFMSFHSPDIGDWETDDVLTHTHKLGSVLDFILRQEEGKDYELELYERVSGNVPLGAENYDELTEGK